jgi:hypothetical protein
VDAYICHWSNGLQHEVDHSHEPRRVVNLEARTYGCGRWQLNGISCPHVICAMYRNRRLPEDYISKWYLIDTYRLSYAPNINPMPGPNDRLIDCDVDPIEPSIPKTQRGRPKKLRRRGDDETVPDESGNCGKKVHNARSCKQPENPNRKKYPKRDRRKPKPTDVSWLFFQ